MGLLSTSILQIQANVLEPPMFMAQEPQIPSRHERRKVRVGSISFLILIRASRTMGPQLFMSTSYDCSLGFSAGWSGFYVRNHRQTTGAHTHTHKRTARREKGTYRIKKNYYFGVSLGLFSLVKKGRASKNTHAAREGASITRQCEMSA